ncbi:hypothetical protein [Shinella sp. BYT-45]|uniref:hypothetical protein n=1 Tax=Shinella sp. BYT-45 TaxID=3377377 RepID=UPI00397F3927
MASHRLRIVGGTDMDRGAPPPRLPTPADVYREARRRLANADIQTLRVRAAATGRDMPRAAHYLALQIEFVARSLAALHPIPADFAEDIYWPC